MDFAGWLQVATVVVAMGAAVIALAIATTDRRHAAAVALADRRAAAEREILALKLDAAIKLAANLAQGGSADRQESSRMGAEALALITVLGREYVPRQWEKRVGSAGDLDDAADDLEREEWVRHKIEAGLAVQKIADRLELLGRESGR
ncbi:hypothetical protein [Demequina sp.]|uniref:hypothetical protein n=1 Tax=Demequina sp. TaxID=2050685 RepID=UPI003A8726BE